MQDPASFHAQNARLVEAVSPLAKKLGPSSARAREYIQARKLDMRQDHLAAIAELTGVTPGELLQQATQPQATLMAGFSIHIYVQACILEFQEEMQNLGHDLKLHPSLLVVEAS